MAMENLEVVKSKFEPCCEDSMAIGNGLSVEFLDDLDIYFLDINDRLTISRMVSESVVKGMVTAVSDEAEENIARKELEVNGLREMLHTACRSCPTFLHAFSEHVRMKETLRCLRSVSQAELEELKKEMTRNSGCNSLKGVTSGSSRLLESGSILHKQSSEKWSGADEALESLETTIETVFKGVEDIIQSSEGSLLEWKQDETFQAAIEGHVVGICIRGVEQEFEGKLRDRIRDDESTDWPGRVSEISSLREELSCLSKSLYIPEAGQLVSHRSLDSEGWSNGKKSHFHHAAFSSSLCEENGKHDETHNNKLENSDSHHLNHLSREELISYYNNEMTRMKRNHESRVQEMTEEYFSLKRDYLREKGPSLLLKDKDFNTLRKKIPEVIHKLDSILLENEKVTASNDAESLSLKQRLESLLAENRQLRGFLTDKKKEVKCLATQVSDTKERMSQNYLSETKLINNIRYLKSSIHDLQTEASIGADVYNCVLKEMTGQFERSLLEAHAEYNVMQQHYVTIIEEASRNAQNTRKSEVEDSDMVPIIMQEFCEVVYRESWQEAKDELDALTKKYIDENKSRVNLEEEIIQKERMLEMERADKERLKQEVLFHAKEKERIQISLKELEDLTIQQKILIEERSRESESTKGDLGAMSEEIKLFKSGVLVLKEGLARAVEEVGEAREENHRLLSINEEKRRVISLLEANEQNVKKQMESMALLVHGLAKASMDLESRVTKGISKNCVRLKNLNSQARFLTQRANILRRAGTMYKQRLERRNTDLQKAEKEVDLLGDEVDTLLSLLEKIYIALDHYAPILQHYPGVIEILKLVKKELSGDQCTRSV